MALPPSLENAELSATGDWAEGAPAASSLELKAGRVQLGSPQPLRWQDFAGRLAYQPQAGGGLALGRNLGNGPGQVFPIEGLKQSRVEGFLIKGSNLSSRPPSLSPATRQD